MYHLVNVLQIHLTFATVQLTVKNIKVKETLANIYKACSQDLFEKKNVENVASLKIQNNKAMLKRKKKTNKERTSFSRILMMVYKLKLHNKIIRTKENSLKNLVDGLFNKQ